MTTRTRHLLDLAASIVLLMLSLPRRVRLRKENVNAEVAFQLVESYTLVLSYASEFSFCHSLVFEHAGDATATLRLQGLWQPEESTHGEWQCG